MCVPENEMGDAMSASRRRLLPALAKCLGAIGETFLYQDDDELFLDCLSEEPAGWLFVPADALDWFDEYIDAYACSVSLTHEPSGWERIVLVSDLPRKREGNVGGKRGWLIHPSDFPVEAPRPNAN